MQRAREFSIPVLCFLQLQFSNVILKTDLLYSSFIHFVTGMEDED